MPKGRPKGSKSRITDAYAKRTAKLKRKYGKDIFREWGKMGGNPILLKKLQPECTNKIDAPVV